MESKRKWELFFVNRNVYDVMYDMERQLLIPLMTNYRLMALLPDNFWQLIEDQVIAWGYIDRLKDILNDTIADQVNLTNDSATDKEQLLVLLSSKFIDVYLNASANDVIQQIQQKLLTNSTPADSLSFRIKVLTKVIDTDKDVEE